MGCIIRYTCTAIHCKYLRNSLWVAKWFIYKLEGCLNDGIRDLLRIASDGSISLSLYVNV